MKSLFSFVFAFMCSLVIAQEIPISFQRYYSKDGLSSNTIFSIYRDSYGFLWLGTEDGLNRFDGSNYKVYRYDGINGLKTNHITALCEDNYGRIWIGTNGGGLSYYDRKLDVIRTYEKTPDDKWLSTAITSIEMDSDGHIWVGSYGGLTIINAMNLEKSPLEPYLNVTKSFNGKLSRFVFRDSYENMWISSEGSVFKVSKDLKYIKKYDIFRLLSSDAKAIEISSITEDEDHRIWLGSMLGLTYLDQGESEFKIFSGRNAQRLGSRRIYALGADNKGAIWVGTDNGLDIVSTKDFSIYSFKPDLTNTHSLSHKSIRSIHIDKKGIFWVGTFQGGLNKYDTNLSQFSLKGIDAFRNRFASSNMVTSFLEYKDKVLIGVDEGGVYVYDRRADELNPLKLGDNFNEKLTVLDLEGNGDDLWVATYKEGLIYYNFKTKELRKYSTENGRLAHNDIFCLKKDYLGNLWVGTNGAGINIIKNDGTVKNYVENDKRGVNLEPAGNYIRVIEEDLNKDIWIGTYGAGISIYNAKSNTSKFYDKSDGLPSNYILSIHLDKQGNAWVGTNGNGIGLLRHGASKFETLSEKEGLINGVVQSIVEADNGMIWFSTNKGLSCYDPIKKRFKNYSKSVGLQEGAFMLRAGLKLSDGEIYFGGQNGFNFFYPKNLKTNKNVAFVALIDLKIDNKIVSPSDDGPIQQTLLTSDQINLKYKQNFSISFAALNLTVPEENKYQYRLVGLDKKWIASGKEQSAYYTNLDPGRYIFQVRASNNDGVWNDQITSIEIIVAPPVWRTIYAYLFYVLLFVGGLFVIRDRGIRKLKQKFALEQVRMEASQLIEQQKREADTLHKLDCLKIKFLTNLSHEFRTPVSLIVGPVDSLIGQVSDSSIVNQLGLIRRNAKRLLNLVNQLLDFRKMEEHELKLQNTEADLISFVEDVYQSFSDIAVQKGIDYSFKSSCAKLYCSFDEDKVERILFNLISNAFKFTQRGGDILVNIRSVEVIDEQVRVTIDVSDTGVGIPKEAHASIFESFFQHDTEGKVLNQGSGIGLSIADSFVKMYNGILSVESDCGKGAIFTFDLLLDIVVELDDCVVYEDFLCDEEVLSATEKRDRAVVLVIEDDDDYRSYIKESLRDKYDVLEASNGKEGWQKALFHHPNIILSDVQMPIMNGMELAQKLVQDRRTKHIPVILLTASRVENGLVCGLESGAVDYLNKPFDIHVLLAKVSSLLLLNQAFKDVYSRQISIVAPEIQIEVSEKDKFLQNALAYVYENIDNPQLSVESLSSHLLISRASLYNRLLDYTGMSPVDFIRSAKLDRAVNLLEKSDKTISEIAYETGFANPNYFTKVFKAKYHVTPSEYIQQFKKNNLLSSI